MIPAASERSASRAVAAASARLALLKLVGCDCAPDVVPWSGVFVGVALEQRDALALYLQLLGDQLRLRGEPAGAQLALPGVRHDPAVRADRDPRVDLRAGAAVHALREQPRGGAPRDHQRAAALKEGAAPHAFVPLW